MPPTLWPKSCKHTASSHDTVLLPTPPLPDKMRIMFFTLSMPITRSCIGIEIQRKYHDWCQVDISYITSWSNSENLRLKFRVCIELTKSHATACFEGANRC